jgi:pimeloyl-ACP methyl ester carboxylesterase
MTGAATGETVALPDHRRLGIAHFGAPTGTPVLYFHGHPGSRLDLRMIDPGDVAGRVGCRVVAVDRPGYGLSPNHPGRTLLNWRDDVAALADALGIARFAVLGYSGGGPYAAACAAALPDRVTAAVIVSGVGPREAPGQTRSPGWVYSATPEPLRTTLMRMTAAAARRTPERLAVNLTRAALPRADRVALSDPRVAAGLTATFREAFRTGYLGALRDAELYAQPWGFRLADIAVPVMLWHGEADVNVPASVGRYVAAAIPGCRATFRTGEGHVSIFRDLERMLAPLAT